MLCVCVCVYAYVFRVCQSGQSGEKQPAIACRSQHDGTHLIRINFVAALGDIENVSVCECACLVRNAHACKTVVVVVVVMVVVVVKVVVVVVVMVVAIAIRPMRLSPQWNTNQSSRF